MEGTILLVFIVAMGISEGIVTEQEYEYMPDLFHFDSYDKCFRRTNASIYCSITIQLSPINPKNLSSVWSIIEEVSSDSNYYRHDILRHGVCINDVCTFEEEIDTCVQQIYRMKYNELGLVGQPLHIQCETKNSAYFVNAEELVFISFLGLYVIFVGLVTLVLEVVRRAEPKTSKLKKFLSVFSLFDNTKLIFIPDKKDNYMPFLQGIRFATSIGVICTHATLVNTVMPVENPSYVEDVSKRYITMLLANGGMTVQIFFVISSFLLGKNFFDKSKTGPISFTYVVRSIVRRYLILTSGYAIMIALHSSWFAYLARGPFWGLIMGEDYKVCRENWWKNLLYINNFSMDDGLCMFQSWYLSAELQFTVVSLLVLWVSQKSVRIFYAFGGFVVVFQIAFMFCYLAWNDFEIAVAFKPELLYSFRLIYSKEWQATWTSAYSNLSAPVSGLTFGYLYTKCRDQQIFAKKSQKLLWLLVSCFFILFPLLFSAYYMITPFYSHARWFAASYGSIAKVLFSFGFGLLIFGMSLGQGGVLKEVLQWRPLYTLGQLSFGVYLVHYSILKITVAAKQTPPYMTDYFMVYDVVTNSTMSFVCSFILSIFVLIPVAKIVRAFL